MPDANSIASNRDRVKRDQVRVTAHAQYEMVDGGFSLADVYEAIFTGQLIEDYPEHRRGACCLICGLTNAQRPLHVVCTSGGSFVVITTVYEPKPPKWPTPFLRRFPQ